jgi:hypothetical protein
MLSLSSIDDEIERGRMKAFLFHSSETTDVKADFSVE